MNRMNLSEKELALIDDSLLVEDLLSDQEKKEFLTKVIQNNPSWRGSYVSDLVSHMLDTDSYCGELEDFFEKVGNRFDCYRKQFVCMCFYVAYTIVPKSEVTDKVAELVARHARLKRAKPLS